MPLAMDDLPRDVLGVVTGHASAADRARLRAVSKRLRDAVDVRADDADILLGLTRRFENGSRAGRSTLWDSVGDEWTRVHDACGVKGRLPATWCVDSTDRASLQAHSGGVMVYILRRFPGDPENRCPPWDIGKPWGASVYMGARCVERDLEAVRGIVETFGAAFPGDDIILANVYQATADAEEGRLFVRAERDSELGLSVRAIVEREAFRYKT